MVSRIRKDAGQTSDGTPAGFLDLEGGVVVPWTGETSAAPNVRDISFIVQVGQTIALSLTVDSTETGQLSAGRYFCQLLDSGTDRGFLLQGPFSDTLPVVVTATVNLVNSGIPLDVNGIIGFEIEVKEGLTDQVAGIMDAGTGTLFITKISDV